ncbi:MAG: aspartate carbamoyltransferase [Oscillospiraceae bacterium]|jgi:aspartate carbamoyltransferase catalytic subunit|nr:aspartate carbamoyltransferase [Oscillospiraceae bacterium]
MRHFIDFSDLTMPEWEELYRRCEDILAHPEDYRDVARGRAMGSLFYEPSTRTSFSFQAAMLRLGGGVFAMSDPGVTSVAKGESLKDTVIMCSGYADVIVIRHPGEGAALAASRYSRVPVVNAGDGGHLHPTQTLTDLAAISRLRGHVPGLRIGFCGDLKHGRTVHSLIRALSAFPGCSFFLISPRELAIPGYLRDFLGRSGQRYAEVTSLEDTLPELDALYMTRVQRERFADPAEYERHKGVYVLTGDKLRAARRELLILHPLPRVDEISPEVDGDPRAAYFEQARLGMYIRMALLMRLLDQPPSPLPPLTGEGGPRLCRNPNCITARERYLPALEAHGACAYCERPFAL